MAVKGEELPPPTHTHPFWRKSALGAKTWATCPHPVRAPEQNTDGSGDRDRDAFIAAMRPESPHKRALWQWQENKPRPTSPAK